MRLEMLPIITTTYYLYNTYKAYESYQKASILPLLEAYSGLATVAEYIPYINDMMNNADKTIISEVTSIKKAGLINYAKEKSEIAQKFLQDDATKYYQTFLDNADNCKKSVQSIMNKESAINFIGKGFDNLKEVPNYYSSIKDYINENFKDYTPAEIIGGTILATTFGNLSIQYGLNAAHIITAETLSFVHDRTISLDVMKKTQEFIKNAFNDDNTEYDQYISLTGKLLQNSANSIYQSYMPDFNLSGLQDQVLDKLQSTDSKQLAVTIVDGANYYMDQVYDFGCGFLFGNESFVDGKGDL